MGKKKKNYRSTTLSMIKGAIYAVAVKSLHVNGHHKLYIPCLTKTGAVKGLEYDPHTMVIEIRLDLKYWLSGVNNAIIVPELFANAGNTQSTCRTYFLSFKDFIAEISSPIFIKTRKYEYPGQRYLELETKKFAVSATVNGKAKYYSLIDVVEPVAILHQETGHGRKAICEIRLDL